MQNLQNMASFKQTRKEKGFTIIELVVVILLLGILAATALPRFMDVTDEAHTAVVDAVEGSLTTSAALFRAQWFAKGQPTGPVPEFGSGTYTANSSGYPYIGGTTSADCVALFGELLQAGGAPSVTDLDITAATTVIGATNAGALPVTIGQDVTSAAIEGVADDGDFVAVKSAGGTVYCTESAIGSGVCDGDGYYEFEVSAQTDYTNTVLNANPGVAVDYANEATALAALADDGGSCTFYYVGQYKDAATQLVGGYSADGDVLGLDTVVFTLGTGNTSRSVISYQ